MNKPLVSIIIPVFNREEVLAETLDSVLMQSYINWECIIVDDGSKDNSPMIIGEYCKKDSRFKFFSRPEIKIRGASSCRNYGFQQSHGQLIQYLDSDDIMSPNKLEDQIANYQNSSQFALFTCKWGWFSEKETLDNRIKSNYMCYKNFEIPSKILETFGYYNEFLPIHNYLIPRSLNLKAGYWNENLGYNDDAEFFTRIIINSEEIYFCNNATVYYRVLNSNPQLSNLDNYEKALSAIISWKIISNHLNENIEKTNSVYVRNALFNLYPRIKKSFPNLLIKEKKFFSIRRNYNSLFFRLGNKLVLRNF